MPPEVEGFLDGITLADVLVWVTAAGAIFAGVKWVIPLGKKVGDFIDDVAGEPARPGRDAQPGLMERIANVEEAQRAQGRTLETVRHELFPNSGKSLRDQTNRIEQLLANDNERIETLSERLEEHITQSNQIITELKKETP